jgi:hypothetical protein
MGITVIFPELFCIQRPISLFLAAISMDILRERPGLHEPCKNLKAIRLFCCYSLVEQHSDITEKILSLTLGRGPDKSICPSEVARLLFPDDWPAHMDEVVDSAIKLQKQGRIAITQKGIPVDPDHIRGPIRLKLV